MSCHKACHACLAKYSRFDKKSLDLEIRGEKLSAMAKCTHVSWGEPKPWYNIEQKGRLSYWPLWTVLAETKRHSLLLHSQLTHLFPTAALFYRGTYAQPFASLILLYLQNDKQKFLRMGVQMSHRQLYHFLINLITILYSQTHHVCHLPRTFSLHSHCKKHIDNSINLSQTDTSSSPRRVTPQDTPGKRGTINLSSLHCPQIQ